MTYVLYGSRDSGSAAVEVALQICGLPYRQIVASTWEPESAIEELTRINPLRQIPTLVLPDGTILTESAAILIHLGLTYPASGLLPVAVSARAEAIRGLVFIAANCYAAIGIIDHPERWIEASDSNDLEQVRKGARARLYRYWEIFADTFPATPYLSGDKPGALDYLATVVSRWSGARTHLAIHRPTFIQVLDRVAAYEAAAPVFRQHWNEPREITPDPTGQANNFTSK